MLDAIHAVPAATWLLHIGFSLSTLAYVLRDILWLRAAVAASYVVFIAMTVMRGGSALWTLLPWYALFVAINALQLSLLVHERWLAHMTADEAALRALAFGPLDIVVVKRLMRLGEWRTLSPGYTLTSEGGRSTRLYLLLTGEVAVYVGGHDIARLGPGQFVGEIGFIGDRPATATSVVMAGADTDAGARCLVWNVAKLGRAMARDQELRAVLFNAVGGDLALKIAAQTVGLTRIPGIPGVHVPETGAMPAAPANAD